MQERTAERTYRASLPTRFGAPIVVGLCLVMIGAAIWGVLGGQVDAVWAVVLFVGALYGLFAVSILPRIRIRPKCIEVRNLIFEYTLPWSSVVGVEDSSRVELKLTDGRTITCWAVQTPNFQLMFNKPGRAQKVGREIREYRAASADLSAEVQ